MKTRFFPKLIHAFSLGGAVRLSQHKKVQNLSSFFVAFFAILLIAGTLHAASILPDAGSSPSGASSYLFAEVRPFGQASLNISIRGNVISASNPPNGFNVGSVNVTATFASTGVSYSQVAGAGGFNFNLTTPDVISANNNFNPYLVYVTDNTTERHNKTFSVYLSNATNVTFTFIDSFPPFTAGTNATINVSYFNGSNAIPGGRPLVQIFKLNGVQQDWLVRSPSTTADTQGRIVYNVTIPSDASGQYALVVDKGSGFLVFGLRSSFVTSFKTETPTGIRRSDFAINAPVNLIGSIRNSANVPYNLAGADSAVAFITLPNASIVSTTLLVGDAVNVPGVMNKTFTQTNLPGRYDVRLVVTVGSSIYETSGFFDVATMTASLEIANNFFGKFGEKRVIVPNATVEFKILAVNASNGGLLNSSITGGQTIVDCRNGNVTFIGFTDVATGANVTNYAQFEPGMPQFGQTSFTPTVDVCVVRIKVPSTTGVYRMDVNVTAPLSMGAAVVTASTFIQTETLSLRVRPIQAAASFDQGEFSFSLPPGENATFQLVAYNFSSGQALPSSVLANVSVQTMSPMSFFGGVSNVFNNFSVNGSGTCAPCGNKPNPGIPYYFSQGSGQDGRLIVTLPDASGFFEASVRANVSGQFVTTRTQFMMKRLEGFAMPQTNQGGQGEQGPSFSFGQSRCTAGNVSMVAQVREVKNGQAAQGVVINPNILQAFDENTGKNIASFLSVRMSNSTNIQGAMTFNLTLSSNMAPGFYPIEFNVSYRGRDDTIFGMLNCRSSGASLVIQQPAYARMRPNFAAALRWQQFFINGPNGFQNLMNGTLELTGATLFDERTRSKQLLLPNASRPPVRVNVNQSLAELLLFPQNLSLTEWPLGRMMFRLNVTNGTLPGDRDGPSFIVGNDEFSFVGGMEVTPFEVFISNPQQYLQGGAISAGTRLSMVTNVSSNVSTSGNNFTVFFNRFGFGNVIQAPVLGAVLMIDAWNTSMDASWEQWNVTFDVPAGIEPGFAGLRITANNSKGVESSADLGVVINRFTVFTLTQQDMFMEGLFCRAYDEGGENGTFENCFSMTGGPNFGYTNGSHMNLSLLNTTYSVASKSGLVCLKRAFNYTSIFSNFGSRFGMPVVVDYNTHLVVVDNNTPGLYDTLVINTSNGTQQIISLNNLSSQNRFIQGNTTAPFTSFYLANIFDCPYAAIVNGSQTAVQGEKSESSIGEFFANDQFYAPFKVLRGSNPIQVNLTFVGYASKNLEGITSGSLPAVSHITRGTTTNNGGVGFVRSNVTVVGRFSAIWDVNTSSGGQTISDRAKTRSDGQTQGGGQGSRVEIINLRMCHQAGQDQHFLTPDANVSIFCGIRNRQYLQVAGVNLTINLVSWNQMGQETRTPAKMFNGSGVVLTKIPTGFMDTGLNFTHPTGWPCNQQFMLEGNATNGSLTQFFHIGFGKRECGTS